MESIRIYIVLILLSCSWVLLSQENLGIKTEILDIDKIGVMDCAIVYDTIDSNPIDTFYGSSGNLVILDYVFQGRDFSVIIMSDYESNGQIVYNQYQYDPESESYFNVDRIVISSFVRAQRNRTILPPNWQYSIDTKEEYRINIKLLSLNEISFDQLEKDSSNKLARKKIVVDVTSSPRVRKGLGGAIVID